MKLLYIDAYHHYLNPTSGLMPVLFSRAAEDVRFYGPGYSSEAELSAGVRAFVDQTGPYDALVLGMQVPIFAWDDDRLRRNAGHVNNYTAFGSSPQILLPFFKDILANIGRLPVPIRLISLLNFDYYVTTSKHTDVFEGLDAHVITPGIQFAPTFDQLPKWAWQEKHFLRKKQMVSDAWNAYLRRHANRVLSLPHFVADSEFSFRGLAERRERVSIPGIEYLMRKEGRKQLKARGLHATRKPIFNLLRYADRLGFRVFSRYLLLTAYHAAYRGNLIDTRFVYTAREGFGIPLRKFFEIPAAGAMMLCMSPIGFSELGFRDGEHYLEVTPDSLPDSIQALERDPERAQAIASAGRKLVFDRHSLSARGAQLARCLNAITQGTFSGSEWQGGAFHVLTGESEAAFRVEDSVAQRANSNRL
jgi:hypothetical protein